MDDLGEVLVLTNDFLRVWLHLLRVHYDIRNHRLRFHPHRRPGAERWYKGRGCVYMGIDRKALLLVRDHK